MTVKAIDEKYIIDRIAAKCKEQVDREAAARWTGLQAEIDGFVAGKLPRLSEEQRRKIMASLAKKPVNGKRPVPIELVFEEAEDLAAKISMRSNPFYGRNEKPKERNNEVN